MPTSDLQDVGRGTAAVPELQNVTLELVAQARARPQALALVLGERRLSFWELDAAVWGAAAGLHAQGVMPGATVALRLRDPASLVLALLGLMRLGATPLTLAPSATVNQVRELVLEARAQYLLVEPGSALDVGREVLSFDERLVRTQDATAALMSSTPKAPCLLVTGSGTTGRPRLMALTHAQMRARFNILQNFYGLRPGDKMMVLSPMYFATPTYRVLAALANGATGIVWDQRGQIGEAVEAAQPSVLHLSVFHAEQLLLHHQKDSSFDLSAVRVVSIGASSISEMLRAHLRNELKACLHINYGTNEAFTICYAYPSDLNSAAGVVGRPAPGVTVEIVKESGCQAATGEIGQVRVRGPAQIGGYLNGSDADRFRDGWFYPGDLAQWAPDGQLIHCGRADQMMIMNGINIYPAEIERVLAEHPAVREVVAFPLQHAVAQDLPVCAVVLHDNTAALHEELEAFAHARLGAKTPRAVVVLKAIPRNEQGKPVRAELTRLVAMALGRRRGLGAASAAEPVSPAPVTDLEPHRRQRTQRLAFNFVAPHRPAPELLLGWAALLGKGVTAPEDCPYLPVGADTAPTGRWLQAVLRVACELLLAARFPVFAGPRLLDMALVNSEQASGTASWRAVVELPVLDQFPHNTYELALKAALRTAAWVQNNSGLRPQDGDAREAFFAWVDQHGLVPLRKLAPQGKSTLHVLSACYEQGVPFTHLGGGIYQLGWGARARRIDRSTTDRDSTMGTRLTQNKSLTATLLRIAGLPGAEHEVVRTVEEARTAAERIGWPVVVKPADAERGEGVQVDVGAEMLDTAFNLARARSPAKRVLVEQQVAGVCHRLFVAGGTLLYAVKRLPNGVYGDGELSVAQLVDEAGARERRHPPWQRSPAPSLDQAARVSLKRAGLHEKSVPAAGRFVALRRIETTAWGGVDEDVTAIVHPENVRAALAACKLCGLEVAGVDFISVDISQPWHLNGAVINEVNFAPLLGGGDISRRHVPEFLDRLLGGDGRIQVEVYVGDEQATTVARGRASALRRQGLATAVTSDCWTEAPDGGDLPMSVKGLHARIRALLHSSSVEAMLIVVQTDELLDSGLPLEGVDAVLVINEALVSRRPMQAAQRRRLLLESLQRWIWPRQP